MTRMGSNAPRPDAPIAPFSEHDLYDVLNDRLDYGEATEFYGIHVVRMGEASYGLVYDGYAAPWDTVDVSEMDDILELVAEIMDAFIEVTHYVEHDRETLMEECGLLRGDGEDRRVVYQEENGDEIEAVSISDLPDEEVA